MLFNSFEFALFLPIVFLLYWFVFDYALSKCKHQLLLQNLFIVVASYIFYGWWDWRFLILIAITTILSFLSGIGIEKALTQRGKKAVMIANIIVNLGILGIYKYYDFFATQFARLFGIESDFLLLHLILPVGISFYTFQALSYSIDVYRKQIQPTHNIVAFTAFLSFFPQLVAGPIERATNLLPQFQKKRTFDYATAVDGMRQILWGLFKKIVVADNCATYVDTVFADISNQSGSTLVLAAVLFTFQIYGDFSGYSDIAIGTAKLFGIKLMRNFNVPYFSRDIAEFWRRWHISLTTWFRDYVYIPLGGSRPNIPDTIRLKGDKALEARYTKWIAVRNTFVIFLLSGFWHGANWTFVLWGAYHALLFVPLLLLNKNRRYRDTVATITLPDDTIKTKLLPSLKETGQMLLTFALAVFGWIIFRAQDISQFGEVISTICSDSLLSVPYLMNRQYYIPLTFSILVLVLVEWINRTKEHGLQKITTIPLLRYVLYIILGWTICLIFMLNIDSSNQFIYFQF
ncbi:MAG: MBOAT family protein [Paludibacteraceae bacterium]|nr:MBOAT family protein [Paludibacteraceae bacterium]